MPHEPEGLLGTLTSCVLCFLGLQVTNTSSIFFLTKKTDKWGSGGDLSTLGESNFGRQLIINKMLYRFAFDNVNCQR
jgi:hypothetical protein